MSLLQKVARGVGRHSRFLSQSAPSLCSLPQSAGFPASVVGTSKELYLTRADGLTNWEGVLRKGFRTSGAASSDNVSVEVPQMGDSITEGSVALITKTGTRFEMDDVIAQIETDKVTLDVRAPVSGTLEMVEVKEGDTVIVGQVLGVMKAGEAPAAAASSTSASEPSLSPPPANPVGHGISFPVRRSPTGERISSMSIEKAQQILGELQGTPKPPPTAKSEPKNVLGSENKQRKTDSLGGWQPPQSVLRRRVLLNSEMEAIMLGGADP